jgi:cytochrome c peroxidase
MLPTARAFARIIRGSAAPARRMMTTSTRAAPAATKGAVLPAGVLLGLGALGLGAGFTAHAAPASPSGGSGSVDWTAVYADIAALLDNNDYDDGSFGPVLVRLAWQ